ncbi:efflux RND transporter periplasmic adaptor subunit [Croceiramulus getboli]|nr:HlyD family efflux transporter periplasmic adaptor subunit [Flavobacteriaceae bacterium YJPT1-3]
MRKTILYIAGVIILGLAALITYLLLTQEKPKRPSARQDIKTVFIDTVKNTTVPIVVPANGNLLAKNRVALFAEVQGVFSGSAHPFKTGQQYTKGQTLIRINAEEYRASVQSAKGNLYNLITAVMPDLQLDYPEVYPKWKAYLDRFDLEGRVPELPEMSSDKERYFINGRNIITSYYNVKNLEQRLNKYYIIAPFTGVLTEALVTEGTLVRPGQQLGSFIDPSIYELEVAVNKSYSQFIKVGETVNLFPLEGNQSYTGKVARINAAVNQASQTVTLFIDVSHPDLKEGMYLEARIDARDEENAIEIPRKLLSDQKELFIVRDSILDVITVDPIYFTDKTAVIKGLKDGTTYLARPVPGAYAGMQVKPYQEVREAVDSSGGQATKVAQ